MSILYCAYNKRIAEELVKKLAEVPPPDAPARIWSHEQRNILNEFENGTGHVVVVALAGVGKTTTGIEGVKRAPEGRDGIQAKTLHAVGLSCIKKFWEDIGVSFKAQDRADLLANDVCGPTAPDAIKKLVSGLHTKGREIKPHAKVLGELTDLMVQFEFEPSEEWTAMGYGPDYVETKALEAMELAANKKPLVIDGSDMIFLPVRNGWLTKTYDMVVVDEAQDMTTAQLEIAQGVCRGRIFVIGDPNQAIYGFRGADSTSIGRLQAELNAKELPLTTTYRCGRAIVSLAQAYVPSFTAGTNNPTGTVEDLVMSKLVVAAGPGDFILSRVNAPLVSTAMQLLRAGKRTRVAGRDIGAGLKTLIRKLRGASVPDLLKKIDSWERKETDRAMKANRPEKVDMIHDQAEMLISLAEGARNVDEVGSRIEALFTDDGLGDKGLITCSSVHRSKGLEANRVFILRETLRADSQEECNIAYVAITRAIQTLVWVRKDAA